jgi:hypothetical protein
LSNFDTTYTEIKNRYRETVLKILHVNLLYICKARARPTYIQSHIETHTNVYPDYMMYMGVYYAVLMYIGVSLLDICCILCL